MDLNGVEGIDLNALGGADTVTVNDLTGTGLVKVQLNLSGSAAAATVRPTPSSSTAPSDDDAIRLSAAGNTILVDGVFPVVRITGAEAANDRLTINTLGGNDVVDDSNLPANLIGLTVILGQPGAAPQVVSVTPNGNLPSLAGPQRSRVASLVITFDQPVLLDANAVTLALHTKNVSFGGAAQPSGIGAVPTSLNLATADHITWTLTFAGNTDDGADGLRSLRDGVYDLVVDATKVHLLAAPGIPMAANSTTTFHRLFGDTGAPSLPRRHSGRRFPGLRQHRRQPGTFRGAV